MELIGELDTDAYQEVSSGPSGPAAEGARTCRQRERDAARAEPAGISDSVTGLPTRAEVRGLMERVETAEAHSGWSW